MSKIGKINIAIPEKVKVALNGNLLNVEGPLGKKSLNIDTSMFDLNIDEGFYCYKLIYLTLLRNDSFLFHIFILFTTEFRFNFISLFIINLTK